MSGSRSGATAPATLLLTILTACTFNVGEGVGTITPVLDDGTPADGFSRPRLGEEDPEFTQPRGRNEAELQPLRSELRLLAGAQKKFAERHDRYSGDLAELRQEAGYVPSPGIHVLILEATREGFSATARRDLTECAIWVGEVEPPRDYARAEGTAGCEGA